jgi:hypothetical protein
MLHKAKVAICSEINKKTSKYRVGRMYNSWDRFQNCEKRLLASSRLTICPSAHMEQLCSQWTDFHEI